MKTTVYFLKQGVVWQLKREPKLVLYGLKDQNGARRTRTIYRDTESKPCTNKTIINLFGR